MCRLLCRWLLVAVCLPLAGCSICGSPEDYTYPVFGGRWQRTDRVHGRVGSAFAPAGERVSDVIIDAQPTPAQEPVEGEVIESAELYDGPTF